MSELPRRDMSRLLAFVVIGGGDVVLGVTGLAADPSNHVPALAKVPPPLAGWNVAFGIVGILTILAGVAAWYGPMWRKPVWVMSLVAVGLWALWGRYIFETLHHPGVSPRSVASPFVFGMDHLLLVPYRRKRDEPGE